MPQIYVHLRPMVNGLRLALLLADIFITEYLKNGPMSAIPPPTVCLDLLLTIEKCVPTPRLTNGSA